MATLAREKATLEEQVRRRDPQLALKALAKERRLAAARDQASALRHALRSADGLDLAAVLARWSKHAAPRRRRAAATRAPPRAPPRGPSAKGRLPRAVVCHRRAARARAPSAACWVRGGRRRRHRRRPARRSADLARLRTELAAQRRRLARRGAQLEAEAQERCAPRRRPRRGADAEAYARRLAFKALRGLFTLGRTAARAARALAAWRRAAPVASSYRITLSHRQPIREAGERVRPHRRGGGARDAPRRLRSVGAAADGIALAAAAAAAGLVARAVAAEGEARAARRRLGDKGALHLEAEVNELRAALDEQSAAASKATHQLELAQLLAASTERDRLQRQLRAARAAQRRRAAAAARVGRGDLAEKLAETGAFGRLAAGAVKAVVVTRTNDVRAAARALGGAARTRRGAPPPTPPPPRRRAGARRGGRGRRRRRQARRRRRRHSRVRRRSRRRGARSRPSAGGGRRRRRRCERRRGRSRCRASCCSSASRSRRRRRAPPRPGKQRAATKRAAADRAELVSARARRKMVSPSTRRAARRATRRVAAGVAARLARALGEWRRAAAEPRSCWGGSLVQLCVRMHVVS